MLGITGVTVPPSSCMSRKNYVAGTHFCSGKKTHEKHRTKNTGKKRRSRLPLTLRSFGATWANQPPLLSGRLLSNGLCRAVQSMLSGSVPYAPVS